MFLLALTDIEPRLCFVGESNHTHYTNKNVLAFFVFDFNRLLKCKQVGIRIRNYLFVAKTKTGMEHTHIKKHNIGELFAAGRLRKTSRSSSQATTLDLERFVDIKN